MSAWVSRQLFSAIDSDRIFEEMDRMTLREKMLEHQELHEGSSWSSKWILSFGVAGGVTVAIYKSEIVNIVNWKMLSIGSGILIATGSAISLGYLWCQRKTRSIRNVVLQLERTRTALRKRRQVYFSVSMRIPRHRHPLILRACRITVFLIECLVEKTKMLNKDESTWKDLYSEEIREITMRSSGNPEILKIEEIEESEGEIDFEAVFETLIAVFKLHVSEYSRVVIVDFLNSSKLNFQHFKSFLHTCGILQQFTRKLESIERLALKCGQDKSDKTEKQSETKIRIDMEIGWRQQTSMALEAVLERLESESVTQSEIELALHKTLVMVGTEKLASKPVSSEKVPLIPENCDMIKTIIKKNGEEDRTDIDMVFEGVSLSDAEKLAASKSSVARNVLLDGSESRIHEANLFGELRMILEPRRTNFAKRERTALAKFYGVDECQLEKEETKNNEEETFEGVGAGRDEEPEPYDWRKDAETSAGIHHEADNDAFLTALNLRRVEDDIIE